MRPLSLPPRAPVLLESMRAIGYDAAAAIADIVDNSIAARARRVSIRFDPGKPAALAFVDDGEGMSASELVAAMRHGARSPGEKREEDDLGRFGLGLKTASLSQCRRLTVVSRKNGVLNGMVWDLDDVERTQDWIAGVLEPVDLPSVPFIDLLSDRANGTLVVWQSLDRLAAGDIGDGAVFSERMQQVTDHLALVFHRHLSARPALALDVNRREIVPLDPFLEDEGAIAGEEERISIDGYSVVLRAFTLPHISRLTRAQIEKAGGEHGLRRQQGFYVYRSRRLIAWGTWFRMFRQEELTKLTRVRVDVPNALDHLWSLDIKKSTATPPAIIRERLRSLVPTMVRQSRQSNSYRGRATALKGIRPLWRRVEARDGIRYEIDLDHPVVAALRAGTDDSMMTELDNVLRAVSESLPIEALYNDRANDQIGHKAEPRDTEDIVAHLEELARQMLGAFSDRPDERSRLLSGLGSIEPFALYPDQIETIQRRLA